YSIRLKHVVIIDILIIASGFVLRALAGGLVIQVPFTPWFLLCTLLLSLFLAINKRRHELVLLQNNKGSHRKVLESYSP
ncbi:decaprenyl-phosphate phosphoribosyltransferase, partial [Bacillus cereus]